MICGCFPPETDIGGLRPAMFSKYLPDFGWQPLIFTRSRPVEDLTSNTPTQNVNNLPDESHIYRVIYGKKDEDAAIRYESLGMRARRMFFPEEANPPGLFDKMIAESHQFLKENRFDIIWATSPNLYTLKVASEISKKTGIPWIADFRDITEQNFFRWDGFRTWMLRHQMIMRRHHILKSASAVITVSKYHAEVLSKHIGREVHIIRNGFDPEMFHPEYGATFPKFSITYMGFILKDPRGRDPSPLFEAIDYLMNNNEISEADIDVSFYGIRESEPVKEFISQYRCHNIVRLLPRVPYNEVPDILRNSCILLTLTDKGRQGILTTKNFEYLGVRRPIIFIPGDNGELDAILQETNAGVPCSTVDSVVQILRKWYSEWRETGTIAYDGRDEEIMKYSRREQAGQLAEILYDVSSERYNFRA